jgi:hypothetical protein
MKAAWRGTSSKISLARASRTAGSEGAEALPELDLGVHAVLHVRQTRVGEDAAGAEGARTELGAIGHEPDHRAVPEETGGGPDHLLATESGPAGSEVHGAGERRRPGPQERALERREPPPVETGEGIGGRPRRGPVVAGRGADPDLLERPLPRNPAVRHAVQGDAAGQAEAGETRRVVDVADHPQQGLLDVRLERGGDVAVDVLERSFTRATRREQPLQAAAEHPCPSPGEREDPRIQPDRAVGIEGCDSLQHGAEPRLAVGREAHDRPLALVDRVAEKRGDGAVEKAEAVREACLLAQLEPVAPADAPAGRGPLADAVHGEDGRLLEGREEERGRRVGAVVRAHEDRHLAAQRALEVEADPELPAQPVGHDEREGGQRVGEAGEGDGRDPLELPDRLLVKDGRAEVRRLESGVGETAGIARSGKPASCLRRLRRSSATATRSRPSATRAAAASW